MKTDECPYDLGGYFIIGNEKVIRQEKIANRRFMFSKYKNNMKYSHIVEVSLFQNKVLTHL